MQSKVYHGTLHADRVELFEPNGVVHLEEGWEIHQGLFEQLVEGENLSEVRDVNIRTPGCPRIDNGPSNLCYAYSLQKVRHLGVRVERSSG
jgi:hypothetical protein